jgi:riboflavin kinase/FMN adenylyltransferase
LPEALRGASVALGNFDGVHFGHRAILAAATAAGGKLGVVTFEPHPRSVLRTPERPFRLTSPASKAAALAEAGVELLVEVPFDEAFASLPPEMFVQKVLADAVGAKHVSVGADFRFGKDRAGTPETLAVLGKVHGFGVTVVEEVHTEDGTPFSSTAIRTHLREGRPVEAAKMLGHWWEVDGIVTPNRQLGRTIGFPTANLGLGNLLEPMLGVYAVRAGVSRGGGEGDGLQWYDAVANLGRRPTVGGDALLLETHIFGFEGDLYDKPLRVQLVGFIRPEQKFNGLDELKAQIARDCDSARLILAETDIEKYSRS